MNFHPNALLKDIFNMCPLFQAIFVIGKNTVRQSFVISFCRPQFWFQWLQKLLFLVCKSLRLAGECLSFPLSPFLATHPICRSIFFSWTRLHCTVLILTPHSDFSSCSLIIFPFPVVSREHPLGLVVDFFSGPILDDFTPLLSYVSSYLKAMDVPLSTQIQHV